MPNASMIPSNPSLPLGTHPIPAEGMIESADEFYELRTSDDPAEYDRAARDEAPLSVWVDVIDRMPDMRKWVAYNKTVPLEILERLACDTDRDVREMVARKRKLPERLQQLFAKDSDPGVRVALGSNANAAPAVIDVLLQDPDDWVRERVAERGRKTS